MRREYVDAVNAGGLTEAFFTEDALAATFAARHAETWRYVAGWGQWLTWSGKLWRREETLQAFEGRG